jgi:hypothetical protein
VPAKLYIETTIQSYLVGRRSRDLLVAAHQELTRDWWDSRRNHFDLYASELVLREVRDGDAELAAQRLELLSEGKGRPRQKRRQNGREQTKKAECSKSSHINYAQKVRECTQ